MKTLFLLEKVTTVVFLMVCAVEIDFMLISYVNMDEVLSVNKQEVN